MQFVSGLLQLMLLLRYSNALNCCFVRTSRAGPACLFIDIERPALNSTYAHVIIGGCQLAGMQSNLDSLQKQKPVVLKSDLLLYLECNVLRRSVGRS